MARLALAQIAQGRLREAEASAGRSLAAARTADNASARGLAHLRLARIAALRDDPDGARAELARAEEAMSAGNDGKGRARIALDRLALEDAPDARTLEALLQEVRDAGWKVLEAEALALRARRASDDAQARADLAGAFALAQQIGEPALLTELACRYAALDPDTSDSAQTEADARCLEAAARHAPAAALRGARSLAAGDPNEARRWWSRQRELAAETWGPEDEARLAALAP